MENARVIKLLRENASSLFGIIDAARVFDLPAILAEGAVQFRSLYQGEEGDELQEVAPYLVSFEEAPDLLERLVKNGWGRSWGVYFSCDLSFDQVRRRLRKFLRVKTEDGQQLYFRFYDPRVLRVFLPTCTHQQITEFFGPINTFWLEAANSSICLSLRLGKTGLETQEIDLGQ